MKVSSASTSRSLTTPNVSVTVDDPSPNVTVFVPFQLPPATTGAFRSLDDAVPPTDTVTESWPVVAPVRVRVITTGDPPSAPLVAAMVMTGRLGATSLSTMFAVALDGDPTV